MFRDGKYYCEYCGKEITQRLKKDLKKVKQHFCNWEHFISNNSNKVEYKEDYVVIYVNYGEKQYECLVDIDDYENKIKNLGKKIHVYKNGYCYFCVQKGEKSKKIKLYRYLLDVLDDNSIIIDHINRNPLDNRRKNLRKANYVLNSYNSSLSKDNFTKNKGVHWMKKRKRWRGSVRINGKIKYTRVFKKYEDCVRETEKIRESMYQEYKETLDKDLKDTW